MSGNARVSLGVLIAILAFVGVAAIGSATPIDDVPEAVGDAIGVETAIAELILAGAILFSAGLALSVSRNSNVLVTVVVLLAILGVLTGIGWLDLWLIAMVALLIALLFGSKLRIWGDSASSKE